ncbi:MAG: hypothetical protein NTX61_01850 [Bacteroidetes bacterium]|nr:hypothetical protein [Bacteroidota bacterium]
MKKLFKMSMMIVIVMIIAYPLRAQSDKEIKDQLKTKSVRQARREAKKLIKEGYYVAPGALLLDKQLENAWLKQLMVDDKGYPLYIVESGNSVAESQTAAKLQANETAKLNIAGSITTQVAAFVENNIANQQLNNEDAASVTQTVAAAKSIIAQELGRTIPLVEIYRKVGKNIEVNIRLAYDFRSAKELAKKIIRKELEDKTKIIQDKLDGLMDF